MNLKLLDLIQNQSSEILNIYTMLDEVMENLENEQIKGDKRISILIDHTNDNVETINGRLNHMDLNQINYDRKIDIKDKELTTKIEITLKENNKNNSLWKIDLSKRLTKIKKETDNDIKVNLNKLSKIEDSDKSVILLQHIKELEDSIKNNNKEFIVYKKMIDETFKALKRELRITRTIANKKGNVKGLVIK